MVAVPLLEETETSASGAMISDFAGVAEAPASNAELSLAAHPARRLAVYPASAGFDLVDELDYLSARTIEPNVFFNPRFLAPAMPRLEDREVRLAVIRDGHEEKSRLRLLLPYSIEKPPIPLGVTVLRAWSHPFGPLGTPLLDFDDPAGVLEDFFAMLARPHLDMPKVFVLPENRLDGPFAAVLRAVAESRNLPLVVSGQIERPILRSDLDGDAYLRRNLHSRHYKEFRRLKRRLGELGHLEHEIARQPEEIRHAVENFLTLEASGWKGRGRSAMVVDRYRAAFAREAVYRLSERDMCRIHTLKVDDRPIACLIVFVESGMAYTWKTAYDEGYAAFSPGTLLMIEVTKNHLEDPNIDATDSCAVPDHPVVSRMWSERRDMGTFVIGLTPGTERLAHKAADQIHFHREARNRMRLLRNRVKRLFAR
ncbi:GNAT family N-acetyltransferase [Chelativorans sp. YIM 93263]|uniref:GNAT family N-acetyltransferase n=1 Tax=Chelativorans sp. YIM 93263 TaxID=2906648 RepID=UPI00237923CD|nr:GNAT family N-acetyltransferase [Chelativorans sp. YIM 93263]